MVEKHTINHVIMHHMSIRIGSNEPNKLYVGTNPVEKIYQGSQQIWSNVPPPPFVGGPWAGRPEDQTLTVTVDEITPPEGTFAPYPVEWRIRVTGTSYATPDWAPQGPVWPDHYADLDGDPKTTEEGVYRLALEAHDPSYQRCQFVVHTGDTGNYRNEWVGSQAHRNKAFQYGQNCGHVYSEPGTYTGRSVYVYDDEGNWGVATLPDLVVTNPDNVFDAASTIVVSPTGDWAGAPAHDIANRCMTMDAASARFEAIKSSVTAGVRICVEAGVTFNERARGFNSGGGNGVNLVDTYGGSARFIYSERNQDASVATNREQLFYIGSEGWAWRICNGEFDLGYDVGQGRPTNPDGWLGAGAVLNRSFFRQTFASFVFSRTTRLGDPVCRTVVHNSDITGCGWFAINFLNANQIGSRDNALYLNDTEMYDNADYSTYGPCSLFALGFKQYDTGTGVRDIGGQQRSATMGTSRGWTGHSIFIREQTIYCLYVRATYLENRGAWSGGGFFGFRGSQPQMRLRNASETSFDVEADGWMIGRGARQFICDSVIVGYFGFGAGDDTRASNAPNETIDLRHTVMENCLIIHDPQSGGQGPLSGVQARGSVRNCIMLCLESPDTSLVIGGVGQIAGRDITRFTSTDNRSGQFDFFLQTSGNILKNGDRYENRHNTFIMLRTTDEILDGDWTIRRPNQNWDDADFEVVEGHNVVSAPRLSVPEGLAEAQLEKIDLPLGMRVLDAWVKFYWERGDYTLPSTVADQAETPAFLYPVDWYSNATTGADYVDSGRNNAIKTSDGTRFYEPANNYPNSGGVQATKANGGKITVIHDCDASGVVQGDGTGTYFKILNNSGTTWPAGAIEIILDRSGSGQMAPDALTSIDQADFKLYRPTTPQPLDGGLDSMLWDFNRNLRPNAGFAISPTDGTNASGALLPL